MALIYEEYTRVLNRCFFDVQNEVGLGRHENSYQRGCEKWLNENGVPFRPKPAQHLRLDDQIVHTMYPDLVVWDMITVELEAVRRKLEKSEYVQTIDYLKFRGDRLGLLVNMGLERVDPERFPYTPPQYSLDEDWSHWTDSIKGRERDVGVAVRDGLRTIYEQHGCGYGEKVTGKLLLFEMRRRGLTVVPSPVASDYYRGEKVHESPLDCLVVGEKVLVTFSALFDENSFNISRGLSFMKALGIEWGVAVDFGRQVARVNGLRPKS